MSEETLGAILLSKRKELKLSRKQVLDKTGVSVEYLTRIECNQLKNVSAGVLWKLVQLYKMDLKPLAILAGIIIKKPELPESNPPSL